MSKLQKELEDVSMQIRAILECTEQNNALREALDKLKDKQYEIILEMYK